MFAGDAVFPGEVHWDTRCPMFAGDAVFPGEVHWDTRCPMFAGDAVFPGEIHWDTRCLMFAGDAVVTVYFTPPYKVSPRVTEGWLNDTEMLTEASKMHPAAG